MAGANRLMRMAKMLITTNNSIKVKKTTFFHCAPNYYYINKFDYHWF